MIGIDYFYKNMNCNLIIKGKYVLTMNEKMDVFNDGIVVVDNDRIIEIGTKEILKNIRVRKLLMPETVLLCLD